MLFLSLQSVGSDIFGFATSTCWFGVDYVNPHACEITYKKWPCSEHCCARLVGPIDELDSSSRRSNPLLSLCIDLLWLILPSGPPSNTYNFWHGNLDAILAQNHYVSNFRPPYKHENEWTTKFPPGQSFSTQKDLKLFHTEFLQIIPLTYSNSSRKIKPMQ